MLDFLMTWPWNAITIVLLLVGLNMLAAWRAGIFLRLLILAVPLLVGACLRRQTQASRDYLNCVYQRQYVEGFARPIAEDTCRGAFR